MVAAAQPGKHAAPDAWLRCWRTGGFKDGHSANSCCCTAPAQQRGREGPPRGGQLVRQVSRPGLRNSISCCADCVSRLALSWDATAGQIQPAVEEPPATGVCPCTPHHHHHHHTNTVRTPSLPYTHECNHCISPVTTRHTAPCDSAAASHQPTICHASSKPCCTAPCIPSAAAAAATEGDAAAAPTHETLSGSTCAAEPAC